MLCAGAVDVGEIARDGLTGHGNPRADPGAHESGKCSVTAEHLILPASAAATSSATVPSP